MGKTTLLIGRTTGVIIDAETAFDPAFWMPPVSGRITKVTVIPGGIAATSLIENGHITLRCSTFGGVELNAPFQGIGLETVPRDMKPKCETECDLEVKAGVAVNLFYYHNVLPVTPEITVYVKLES